MLDPNTYSGLSSCPAGQTIFRTRELWLSLSWYKYCGSARILHSQKGLSARQLTTIENELEIPVNVLGLRLSHGAGRLWRVRIGYYILVSRDGSCLFTELMSGPKDQHYFSSPASPPRPPSVQSPLALPLYLPSLPSLLVRGRGRGPSSPTVNLWFMILTITILTSSYGSSPWVWAISSRIRIGGIHFRGEAGQVSPVLADNNLHRHHHLLHQHRFSWQRILHPGRGHHMSWTRIGYVRILHIIIYSISISL